MSLRALKRISAKSKELAQVQQNMYQWTLGAIQTIQTLLSSQRYTNRYPDVANAATVDVLDSSDYNGVLGFWLFTAGAIDGTGSSAALGFVTEDGMTIVSLNNSGLSAISRETASGNIQVTNSIGSPKTITTLALRLGDI